MIKKPQLPEREVKLKVKFSLKKLVVWFFVILILLSFFSSYRSTLSSQSRIPLSQALSDIKDDKVQQVEIEDSKITLTYKDDKVMTSRKEPGSSFTTTLKDAGISPEKANLTIKDVPMSDTWVNILVTLLPIALMAFFFFYIFRQARGAQDSIFSFGRSTARLFSKGKQNLSFADVAGVEEAKKELEEVVDFLRHSQKYRRLGARTPKGVLLVGPAGTGKTLLAKAVAGEANVPFFSMAGSEFMEMLVGVGASRVRDLFGTAKKAAPSIIFIDEIDAIGRHRGGGMTAGHDEREQTLNQILVEMDGFTPNDHVLVIAATNRGDLLDPALLRPGRFDRRVVLDFPDIQDRKNILAIHARGKPFVPGIDWDKVAKRTAGFSGADLENVLNEAAILTARINKNEIAMEEIEEAALKVKLGPEKRRLFSEEERKMTAYHEAGHAVVSYYLPHIDPVHRISIVSRGMALGFTMIPPKKDRYTETRSHLLETVTSLLGGRAAEELIFDELTGGASSDIDRGTLIARKMVVDFGMSRLGPIHLGPQFEEGDYARAWMQPSEISQEMQSAVDKEIREIIGTCYVNSTKILKENKAKLDMIAKVLIDRETLEGEEFDRLMKIKLQPVRKIDRK